MQVTVNSDQKKIIATCEIQYIQMFSHDLYYNLFHTSNFGTCNGVATMIHSSDKLITVNLSFIYRGLLPTADGDWWRTSVARNPWHYWHCMYMYIYLTAWDRVEYSKLFQELTYSPVEGYLKLQIKRFWKWLTFSTLTHISNYYRTHSYTNIEEVSLNEQCLYVALVVWLAL